MEVKCGICGKGCGEFPAWGFYDFETKKEVGICEKCAMKELKKLEKCKGCKECNCGGE